MKKLVTILALGAALSLTACGSAAQPDAAPAKQPAAEAPTEPGDAWKWTSVRDAAATDTALLASSDDTKKFEYKNGQLSYELSMMGETTTLHLEKQ